MAEGPFNKPGTSDAEAHAAAKAAQNEGATTFNQAKQNAMAGTDDVVNQAVNTPGTALSPNQNTNYATKGGQYGRFNNRDYGTTLRMARKAQAYNAMPVAQREFHGAHGQIQNTGAGYEKPQLETYEQKAMQQTQQLDTQQKLLAQHLQAAINSKNLEAFKEGITQKFGINLDNYSAQRLMGTLLFNTRVGNAYSKDMNWWNALMQPAYAQYVQSGLYNMGTKNQLLGMGIGSMLGTQGYGLDEVTSNERFLNMWARNVKDKGMTPDQAAVQAQNDYQRSMVPYFNDSVAAGRGKDSKGRKI